MAKIFMISDTHFCHENIIKYENRPYKDTHEMNGALLANWNKVVKNDDKVFVLGDFGLGPVANLKEITRSLNGYKILVKGNHDRSRKTMLEIGFDEVYDHTVIYKNFWILSHKPIYMNESMPYVNIHGHIHSLRYDSKSFFNVSVECINYTPIDFEEIKAQYIKEEEND